MDEKQIKKDVLKKASASPEDFFPAKTLKEKKFNRNQCSKCERFFWNQNKSRKICGDSSCTGGFDFVGNSPAKKKLDYVQAWQEFAKIHKKLGYTPIKRYPVVARWNPTVDFTIADIAAFQPYVVSGEIKPPANPLVIPQFCLRFNDVDNIGITGHFGGFVMMGEKEFVPPEKYDVERYFKDHLTWLTEGMGIPPEEITIHEDVWAGGGNLGPSLEFFSRGLEVSNQVYMQYEILEDGCLQDLKIKVLDMGQGQERVAWFTQGAINSYEVTFPTVLSKLRERTRLDLDEELMKKFMPHAAKLNVDEVDDINKAWDEVGNELGMSGDQLRAKILPQAALYSVAEHTRALLFAINDGALPSNVGGMYNLRVILRRALQFIDKYAWEVSLPEIAKWHAEYLKPLYPELSENLDHVELILNVEAKKYAATRKRAKSMIPKLLDKKMSTEQLVQLYDSEGISPELIRDEAEKLGKKFHVPADFYYLVSQRHTQKEQTHETVKKEKVPIPENLPETKALYFDDYTKAACTGKVLEIVDNHVILDQTCFYPTSGGQLTDHGEISGQKVEEVSKQGPYIIHKLVEKPKFSAGDKVDCVVDFDRRLQLAQHHTSTHIVNAAAKKVLGAHVNQAGAKKDTEKAHIDITHYEALSETELEKIEAEANKIVAKGVKTELSFVPRAEAEKKYGMEIYQGGAVPGKLLRIVNIPGIDVEACGGTHLKNTLEAGKIVILKANKVKDGIVRITFAAGKAAERKLGEEQDVLNQVSAILDCGIKQIPGRAEELFKLWKKTKKAAKKKQELPDQTLKSTEEFDGDLLAKTAEILQTQPQHVVKTIERFKKDLEGWN